MKFVCTYRDPGGALVTFAFEDESKEAAIEGLVQRCLDRVQVMDGARVDGLIVWPEVIVYEDMTFSELDLGFRDGANIAQIRELK